MGVGWGGRVWRVRWLLMMMYSRLWNQGRAHVCPWYEATDASGSSVMVKTTSMPVHLTNTSSTIHALALAIAMSPRHVSLMVIAVSTETASDKARCFDETSNRRRRLVPPQPAESELGQRLDTCFSASTRQVRRRALPGTAFLRDSSAAIWRQLLPPGTFCGVK